MKLFDLNKLVGSPEIVSGRIVEYEKNEAIRKQPVDIAEIKGRIAKAENNLRFIRDNIKLGYFDWCITGCYYTMYQAALALLTAKGFYSKNHDATLCLLIREYYEKGISGEDIELINRLFIDYNDLVFYVQSKNKREEATYSSKYLFDRQLVEELRVKAVLFVDKAKEILENAKI